MLYESLNNQYHTIGDTVRTNSNHKPNEKNNFVLTETTSENINKQNLYSPNNSLNTHTIPIREYNTSHPIDEYNFDQVAFLYEQNTNRTIKRNKQMRRIQSKLPIEEIKIEKEEIQCKYNSNYSKIVSLNFLSSTGTLKTCNESPSIIITERVTTEGQTNRLAPIQFIIEDNNLNESDHLAPSVLNSNNNNNYYNDAEINVSDLDCDIQNNDDSESVKSQSLCSSTSRSFVSLANNLINKKDAKEDNSTLSYLLALGQSDNNKKNCTNNPNDVINNNSDIKNNDEAHKHVRLPSGKNFLISSVIEEEKSDLLTDSEISNKKLSFLLSTKQKIERALGRSDSDFKLNNNKNGGDGSVTKDLIKTSVDKNLDKLFFFNLQKKRMSTNNNNINKANENNIIDEISISDNSGIINDKEDISAIQRNLKRTYNEIAKEYDSKEETRKNIIESTKKAVLDLFFHINNSNKTQNITSVKEFNTKNNDQALCLNKNESKSNKINLNIFIVSEQNQCNNNNEDSQNQKEEIETYDQIHEKYKENRKNQKSCSIFKSEDLKVRKIDDVYLDTSKLVSPMSNEQTDNLFFSSIKSDLKYDSSHQKNHYETDKLNEIKQQLFLHNLQSNKVDSINAIDSNICFQVNSPTTTLQVSKEISFDMFSIYRQPKIRERNISMEISSNTNLHFEGIRIPHDDNNNIKATKHTKHNSYFPSLKLSQLNVTNHNNKEKEKDNELFQDQSTAKLLNNFSSMLSQLKFKSRFSSTLGKARSSSNKDSSSTNNNKERPKNIVNYLRFNTSSRDKNIFNKQSNANGCKDKSNNIPEFSKPFLINRNNNINQYNKCPNVTVLDTKKQNNNSIYPKKLFNPCMIKPIDDNSKDSVNNNNSGNKKSILNTLNYLSYYRDKEKKEAIKGIDISGASYFALYIREDNQTYVSIYS